MVDNEKPGSDKSDGANQDGKSSNASRYQQPRKTSKHTKSETNAPIALQSKDTLLSKRDGDASSSSDYQYPNPERAYIDMSVRGEKKVPTRSMVTSANHQLGKQSENKEEYLHPRVDQQSNSVVQSGYEEYSATNHDQFDGILSDYQHPKPSSEHTGNESRKEQDGNSVLLSSELPVPLRNNHLHVQGESSSAPPEYQHPKPSIEHTGSENRADQKENSVTPSKCGPTSRAEQVDHTVNKSKEDKPSKPPRYSKPAAVPLKAPSHYPTSSPPSPKLAPPSAILVAPSPPSDLSTEGKSRDDNYYQSPDVKFWTSENGDQNDKNETGSIKISAGESLYIASTAQSLSPSLSDDGNSSCESSYQIPEIQSEFLENKSYSLPRPLHSSGIAESNLGHHIPEVDTEFLESGDKSLIQPCTLPPVLPPKRPLKESPSSKPFMALTTSTTPTLPARLLSQKSSLVSKFSASSEPPVLPSKSSSLKFPRIRQTTKTSGLPPPALPSKAPSQKSPSETSSSPPTLPPRKQCVKSPEIEAPESPETPPVPRKAAPLLPAEMKPLSPPPTQYAELNELHRQDDDTENYQHLIPMQNIK